MVLELDFKHKITPVVCRKLWEEILNIENEIGVGLKKDTKTEQDNKQWPKSTRNRAR